MKYLTMLLVMALALCSTVTASAWTWGDSKPNSLYGNLDTATVGTVQFFRPNGSTTAATTVTAATVVSTKVYVEQIIWNWKDEDLAGQFTVWDTPGATTNAEARKVREFVADASAADLLNTEKVLDLTNHGTSAGIWFKNNPAILVDSGLNTPVVTILYKLAPRNKVQP